MRTLDPKDLEEADRIARVAFGTFLGMPDPAQMFGDKDMLKNRFKENTSTVLAAYSDEGNLLGTNVVSRWGSFGWFGPLTVRPELWDRGVATKLMTPTMDLFSSWKTTQEGLFTFPNSPKHIGLYHKFGFHARFLTPIMVKKVAGVRATARKGEKVSARYFSEIKDESERRSILQSCREVTESISEGLDLSNEIKAVKNGKLGDTVLLTNGRALEGFAICHCGLGTEGGSGNCYVKFGAVRKNDSNRNGTVNHFSSLLSIIEEYARRNQIPQIEAGVNLGRREAFEIMQRDGFKTEFIGVAMQRPDSEGYNASDVFAIDDWR